MSLLPLGTLQQRQDRARRAGKLDCAFCGLGYTDFNSLAFHVANRCRFVSESVLSKRAEQSTMSKKAAARKHDAPRYASGAIPDAGPASADRGDRRAFLRVGDIPASGAVVVFNGESRVVKGSFGDQLMCGVRIGGREYDWGIRLGGSVHRALQAVAGKRIKPGLRMNVEPREFENDKGELIKFIAVVED